MQREPQADADVAEAKKSSRRETKTKSGKKRSEAQESKREIVGSAEADNVEDLGRTEIIEKAEITTSKSENIGAGLGSRSRRPIQKA